MEAVSILGSLLSLPVINVNTRVLQPNEAEIVTTTCPYAKVKTIILYLALCLHKIEILYYDDKFSGSYHSYFNAML